MTNGLTSYYFNEENWDAPEIVDGDGNIIDTLNVGEDMYSWFVMNGRVYTAYEQSHYGAIIAGLMQIHHLENEEQIEKKFGEQIDDICQDIRYSKQNEGEGRFWCKYNIIEYCGSNRPDIAKNLTDNYVQQVCQQVGVNKNDVYVLGEHVIHTPYDYLPIVKYLNTKTLTESILRKLIRESIDEIVNGGEKFKPTVQWISENYAKANQELFGGSLGDCVFKAEPITSHSRWLGMFSFGNTVKGNKKNRRLYIEKRRFGNYGGFDVQQVYINRDNFFEICKPTITMNTMYSGNEFSLYCTLVHEMCHYYTYMNGHFPVQSHGAEFRQIGQVVQYRSNGEITIQRLASAEQMEGYDLDTEEKARRERQAQNKAAKMKYIIVFKLDGEIRLVSTTLDSVVNTVAVSERKKGSTVIQVRNRELGNAFFDDGYRRSLRRYAYYPLRKNQKALEITEQIISNPDNYDVIIRGNVDLKV